MSDTTDEHFTKKAEAKNRKIKTIIAWLGTAGLLAFLGLTTDFETAMAAFKNANLTMFLTTVVVSTFLSYVVDVVTVRHLLAQVGIRIGFGEFAKIKGASYLLNIINYNLALVMMAAVVKQRTAKGWGAAGSPFLLLNFIDLSVFGVLVLLAVLTGNSPFEITATVILTLISAGAVVAVPFLLIFSRWTRAPGFIGKIANHDLMAAFRHLSFGGLVSSTLLRALLIGVYIVMNYFFLQSFDTNAPVSKIVVYMPILSLIAFIPISVAGIGSTQVAMRGFYGPYVSDTLAVGTLAKHAVVDAFSTASIVGVILLRVAIGLVCLPFVSKTMSEENAPSEK